MLLNRNDSILLLVDVQEKLIPAVLNKDQFIKRCEWLLKLASRMDVPVLTSEQYPQGLGSTIAELTPYCSKQNGIEKAHFSCVQADGFMDRLREFRKNQIILLGMEAHVCILQTAFELKTAQLEVFVVIDAVTSRTDLDCKYGLKRMKQYGVHLITAEMVFFEWLRGSSSPNFKALSKEFLKDAL